METNKETKMLACLLLLSLSPAVSAPSSLLSAASASAASSAIALRPSRALCSSAADRECLEEEREEESMRAERSERTARASRWRDRQDSTASSQVLRRGILNCQEKNTRFSRACQVLPYKKTLL